jgi:hypothetical protein
MKVRYSAVLALVAGLALCPRPMGADSSVFNDSYQVDLAGQDIGFVDNCGVDWNLTITKGSMLVKTHINVSASGVENTVDQEVYQGVAAEAVDDDGNVIADYRLVGVANGLHSIIHEDGQIESTQRVTMSFIGKGQAPNVSGHSVLHTIIHPDYTTEGWLEPITLDCP